MLNVRKVPTFTSGRATGSLFLFLSLLNIGLQIGYRVLRMK